MTDTTKLFERIRRVQAHCSNYSSDLSNLEADLAILMAGHDGYAMVAEIVRLREENVRFRAILAELREPSDAVEIAATHEYYATLKASPPIPRAIRAAIAAAEKEVGRG